MIDGAMPDPVEAAAPRPVATPRPVAALSGTAGARAADGVDAGPTDGEPAGTERGDGASTDDLASLGQPGDALTDAQLEALLFVAERPLTRRELGAVTGASASTIDARLGDLQVALASRGIRLIVDGERVALATAPEAGLLIGRYIGRDPTRLSPAMLETLAIVAYRQPATKNAIERIRGVDADYAIRSLVHRRLVVELGRSDAPGRPILYGTGIDFLERFGLTSIEDLPVVEASVAERLTIPEGDAAIDDVPGPGGGVAAATARAAGARTLPAGRPR